MSQTVWTLWEQGDLVGIYAHQADAETDAEAQARLHAPTLLPASRIEVVAHELRDPARQSNREVDSGLAEGEQDPEYLPWTTLTLDDARRTLSAWHFAKEALSNDEQRILYVAEALLRLIDECAPKPYWGRQPTATAPAATTAGLSQVTDHREPGSSSLPAPAAPEED